MFNKALHRVPNNLNLTRSQFGVFHKDHIINDLFEDIICDIFIGDSHDFIIHYDAISSHFIDKVLAKTSQRENAEVKGSSKQNTQVFETLFSPAFLISNYDKLIGVNGPVNNALRHTTMHIVSLSNPSRFEDFNEGCLKTTGVVVFVCHSHYENCAAAFDDGTLNPSFLYNSDFLSKVFITMVIEFSEGMLRLYEVCYYCGIKSKTLSSKYEIVLQHGMNHLDVHLDSEIRMLLNKKNWNFHEHTFDILFIQHGISFDCVNSRNVSEEGAKIIYRCDRLIGLEGEILKAMKKKLNFTHKMVSYENTHGTLRESMIDIINQSGADWAVGSITATYARWGKVDFSVSLFEDPSKVVYGVRDSFIKDVLKLAYVFTSTTWIVILLTLVTISAGIHISSKAFGNGKFTSFSRIVCIVGFLLADQPYHGNLRSVGGRILILWFVCCITISNLYKAQLSSFITKPPKDALLGFDDLVKDGYNLNLVKAAFIRPMLNSSSDKLLQELSHRVTIRKDMCLTMKEIIGEKEMYIEEQDTMNYLVNYQCKKVLTTEDLLNLRMTQDAIFPSSHVWAFKKRAPYLYFINKDFMRLREAGLLLKWSEYLLAPTNKSDVYFNGFTIVDNTDVSPKKIKFYGHFVLWIIGIGLSCASFGAEVGLSIISNKRSELKLKKYLCSVKGIQKIS